MLRFDSTFEVLTERKPFPWQVALYDRFAKGDLPSSCNVPTGLGKTSVIPIWLIALANQPEKLPRRLVYVVNRRTVVDQTTEEVAKLRKRIGNEQLSDFRAALVKLCASHGEEIPFAISTLRGQFADNREWSADPSRPAVICGTVDMIGSRLLFSGYGIGARARPLHAGFLGQDALLVHDEAHLEPAFQDLLRAIESEQAREAKRPGRAPLRNLQVIALSATTRDKDKEVNGADALTLTEVDKAHPIVKQRINAVKMVRLHPETKLADDLARLALVHKTSGCAVLVFARLVEDVEKIAEKLRKEKQQVAVLTGTMRGLEREELITTTVFKRFHPESAGEVAEGTVYLVCTSAGEVGINISADHLVCDLSTFDSMAQRFGRVNRFGKRDNTQIDIVHPEKFGKGDKLDEMEERRQKTLELLKKLNGNASPAALDALPPNERRAAFAPAPVVLRATDILFDAWSLTTIRGRMPGRPPVSPYLHGISPELPETYVAWRTEVEVIKGELLDRYDPEELLEQYPLKPHELLKDRSKRVFEKLQVLAKSYPQESVWLIDEQNSIDFDKSLKDLTEETIEKMTVLLPPKIGGFKNGFLDGAAVTPPKTSDEATGAPNRELDVSDKWYDDEGSQRRSRKFSDERQSEPPEGMRLLLTIDTQPGADEDNTASSADKRYWHWYTQARSADDDLSKSTLYAIPWEEHTNQVAAAVSRMAQALKLPAELAQALLAAARFHDLGKQRELWQRSIGNPNPTHWHAKSGRDRETEKVWKPRDICPDYRHEFGSLLDIWTGGDAAKQPREFTQLSEDMRELVLHLVAAHHGYARPHFPAANAIDRDRNDADCEALALEVPRRFARLQRRYGRWGLAYLESLLRAADWEASAQPEIPAGKEVAR